MSKSGFVIKNLDPTISEVSITDRNKRQVDIITELRNFKHIDSISLMQNGKGFNSCVVLCSSFNEIIEAVSRYNGSRMRGVMISVQPIKSKEQMEGESEKSAFISGLKDDLDFALFSQRMKTVYCISSMFPLFRCDGTFTGKVYVVFDTIQERDAAVSYLNGTTYDGAPIQAEKFTKEYTTSQQRNCFVKFIPLAWTQARLTEYCSRFGEVESCIIRDAEEGAEFTTGFVCFVTNQASTLVCSLSREDAQNPERLAFAPYLSATERKKLKQRERAKAEQEQEQACEEGRVLLLRGLGEKNTAEWVRQQLEAFGEIVDVHLFSGRVGGKHSCYVTFAQEPSASNALRFLRGQRFQKQGIYSLLAESKDRLAKKKTKEAAKKTKAIQMNAEPKELELDLTHMNDQLYGFGAQPSSSIFE